MIIAIIIYLASIAYLWAAESDNGPLADWSHDNYEHRGWLWFILMMTTMIIAVLGTVLIIPAILIGLPE